MTRPDSSGIVLRLHHLLRQGFTLDALGSSVGQECRAGLVTFLNLSYILAVNPQVLADAGLPAGDVATATAVASALACLIMGLYANYPFALAPGMGLNAYFTYGVVLGLGVDWRTALGAVFVEGLVFVALTMSGIRTMLMRAIPTSIKIATMSGIGLLLGIIGFESAGIIVEHPTTLVTLGDLHRVTVVLSLGGVMITGALMARRVTGAMLIGVLSITAICWGLEITPRPDHVVALPVFPVQTFWAFDLADLVSAKLVVVVLAFLFVDVFDTAGTLIGVGMLAGHVDERGELPRADRAFAADAVGTVAGAILGTSPVTTYIESATGVHEGGRSGLTAVVVAVLFLGSLFFLPLVVAVPSVATAPALIVVGALMMGAVRGHDWSDIDESLPAFLTIAAMPFSYSIANGISLGIVSWVSIRVLGGRLGDVNPLMYLLCALVVAFYGWDLGP